MTQAFNLAQLANNLNTSGQLDATDGLTGSVPIVNGGTGSTTALAARSALGTNDASNLTTGTVTNQRIYAGAVLQLLQTSTSSVLSTTAVIPWDDTVPLVTEGTEWATLTITPSFTNSKILVQIAGWFANITGGVVVPQAIFRGSTCIYAFTGTQFSGSHGMPFAGNVLDLPNTTSPVTYSVRYGTIDGQTAYLNTGFIGVGYYGAPGKKSTLTLTEVKG
jgi:hypothetical protein